MLTASAAMVRRYPHGLLRQSPTAEAKQETETSVKRTAAHGPMLVNEARARGLTLHIGSSHEPGTSSDAAEVMLMMPARTENDASSVIPSGRRWLASSSGRSSTSTTWILLAEFASVLQSARDL